MNFFEIMAECSIALTGFGAIHAALRGSDHPRGVFRAWSVVLLGAVSFMICVFPLLLAQTDLPAAQTWRLASVAGLLLAAITVYSGFNISHRLTELGYPSQSFWLLRLAQVVLIVAFVALLLTLIGWPRPPGPFPYALAPACLLFAGLVAMLHAFLYPLQLILTGQSQKAAGNDAVDKP
jgi:hypothetical protein